MFVKIAHVSKNLKNIHVKNCITVKCHTKYYTSVNICKILFNTSKIDE